jgi:putative membrane protein
MSVVITMMWGYGGGWGPWIGMGLGMTLFWGLVILGVIVLVRYSSGTGAHRERAMGNGVGQAEQILADRFARGEINEDEYRTRRELLREGR